MITIHNTDFSIINHPNQCSTKGRPCQYAVPGPYFDLRAWCRRGKLDKPAALRCNMQERKCPRGTRNAGAS